MATPKPNANNFTSKVHVTSYPFISPLNLDLTGRYVLITGTAYASGVGYATATAFARAGASGIVIADVQPVSNELVEGLKRAALEAGKNEPLILASTVDISDKASVERLSEEVQQRFAGRLDVLLNNAAVMEALTPFLEMDESTYWKTWEVNVRGLFNMARAFMPMLLSSKNDSSDEARDPGLATMINLSSSGALSPRAGSSSYRTSKLAILGWTSSLQAEYADQGLLTYCVNPGAIATTISEGVFPEAMRRRFPMQSGLPGDTIAWLAKERREWVAGRYVSAHWDMEEFEGRRGEIVEGDLLKMGLVA